MTDKKLQVKFKDILDDIMPYQPEKVIVFGSFVRGKTHKWSDIDMLIVKKTNEPFLQRLKKLSLMCKHNIRPVDFLVYTPEEFNSLTSSPTPFFNNIIKEGKIIYEK